VKCVRHRLGVSQSQIGLAADERETLFG
jgi:hypothetical protein